MGGTHVRPRTQSPKATTRSPVPPQSGSRRAAMGPLNKNNHDSPALPRRRRGSGAPWAPPTAPWLLGGANPDPSPKKQHRSPPRPPPGRRTPPSAPLAGAPRFRLAAAVKFPRRPPNEPHPKTTPPSTPPPSAPPPPHPPSLTTPGPTRKPTGTSGRGGTAGRGCQGRGGRGDHREGTRRALTLTSSAPIDTVRGHMSRYFYFRCPA